MVATMIDTVVFDLGGVLIDWHPRHLLQHVADGPASTEELIVALDIAGAQRELDRGAPIEQVRSHWRERYADHAGIVERYFDDWDDTIAGAFDDVVAILDELRSGSVRLYALSNWSGDLFRRNRDRFPFLEWFDGLVISGEEQLIKPDPKIFAFRPVLTTFDRGVTLRQRGVAVVWYPSWRTWVQVSSEW
jgi:2-haloacid dehalogenase